MRIRHTIGGCIAAVTAIMASVGLARAEPPASTTLMELTTPVIACDTKDQMMQVVQSIKSGNLRDKLTELEANHKRLANAGQTFGVVVADPPAFVLNWRWSSPAYAR